MLQAELTIRCYRQAACLLWDKSVVQASAVCRCSTFYLLSFSELHTVQGTKFVNMAGDKENVAGEPTSSTSAAGSNPVRGFRRWADEPKCFRF